MLYFKYAVSAVILVLFAVKASEYVSLLDRKSQLPGAFFGGILLSAVTSLPELFTSMSSALIYDRPGMAMGNVLGSNLFNLAILSVIILFNFRAFHRCSITRTYRHGCVFVMLIYIVISLNFAGIIDGRLLHLKVASIIIIVLYFIAAKYLAIANDVSLDEAALSYHAAMGRKYSKGNLVALFIVAAIGIAVVSVVISAYADFLAERHGLTEGFAGALFLGIVTSVPEIASTLFLFRNRNYNLAVGNIIGSNLFNFIILSCTDFFSIGSGVYTLPDEKTFILLLFGMIATPLLWLMIRFRKAPVQKICAAGIILSFAGFLIL